MDIFRAMSLRKARKAVDKPASNPEDLKYEEDKRYTNMSSALQPEEDDYDEEDDDDDDDEFFKNEVKNKLKEIRKNSFMMLIPEESGAEEEDEEEGETSSSEWREGEGEFVKQWCGFDTFYAKYCEGMQFFDQLGAKQMRETGAKIPSTPPPRSSSQKLSSPFRCLSLKNVEEEDEHEHFYLHTHNTYADIETAYVGQVCLSWETLNYQYIQLCQLVCCQPQHPTSYSHAAQLFQQFQVLLQRFIENEPFEEGRRPEAYIRTRSNLSKLLQVPIIQGSDQRNIGKEDDAISPILATDLIKIIESSVFTFDLFLRRDKGKLKNPSATSLQMIHSPLLKKKMKLKVLKKKATNRDANDNYFSILSEEINILFGLVDVRVVERVIRMERITKEQLSWCEEKMKNLDLSYGKLRRDHSPLLFPFP